MPMNSRSLIKKSALEHLAKEREADFEVLCQGRRFAAAIYLGVYAVECLLKAHVCRALDLDELPETYKAHHLETLLLHSGLNRRIQAVPDVLANLKKLDGLWNPADEARNVRYIDDPTRYDSNQATEVRNWMLDPGSGVITWLRAQL